MDINFRVISPREIQRNYRQLVDKVKRTKKPIFIGPKGKVEVVLLDRSGYARVAQLQSQREIGSREFLVTMKRLRRKGSQKSLLKALRHDRERL